MLGTMRYRLQQLINIIVYTISAGDHEVPGNPETISDTVVHNYVQVKSWGLLIFTDF